MVPFSGHELTDAMIQSLSERITNEADLQKLATNGLKVEGYVIDSHVTNARCDITLAALKVLKSWRNDQGNSKIAYRKLCDALRNTHMVDHINVLERFSE